MAKSTRKRTTNKARAQGKKATTPPKAKRGEAVDDARFLDLVDHWKRGAMTADDVAKVLDATVGDVRKRAAELGVDTPTS